MKAKKRQKLCYNCEGEVDLDVIVCPFCAADLRVERPEAEKPAYTPSSLSHNFSTNQSLYPPHYAPKVSEEEEEEPLAREEKMLNEEFKEEAKGAFGPVFLLSLGAQLFLLGLFMLLFSHEGVFTLKWDARLWFFYILASVPLFAFGAKALQKF